MPPVALDRSGQAADELARVDDGVLAAVDRAEGALDPDPRVGLGRVEAPVAGGPARPLQAPPVRLERGQLLGSAGDGQRAALGVVGVDPLAGDRRADGVDRAGHGVLDRAHPLVAEAPLEPLRAGVQARGDPAPVAAGRPEAGDLALEQGDLERRIAAEQGS